MTRKWYHVSDKAAVDKLEPTKKNPIDIALLLRLNRDGPNGCPYRAKLVSKNEAIRFLTLTVGEIDGYWCVVGGNVDWAQAQFKEFVTLCADVGLDISDIDD